MVLDQLTSWSHIRRPIGSDIVAAGGSSPHLGTPTDNGVHRTETGTLSQKESSDLNDATVRHVNTF